MATYSASVMTAQPKRVHAGANVVHGNFNLGATASSAGDIIMLAKIPTGAVVTGIRVDHSTGATAQALSYGLATGGPAGAATYSAFISSLAQATVSTTGVVGGIPYTVSVSDTDPNKYGVFSAKVESGTATTSLIVNFCLTYQVDQIP